MGEGDSSRTIELGLARLDKIRRRKEQRFIGV
jgi:hypothetical protein